MIHSSISKRSAFTLLETTLSTLFASLTIAAALSSVAAVNRMKARDHDAELAFRIASYLLSEITALPFQDPRDPTNILGTEPGEANRDNFDDCDDYHQLTLTNITNSKGEALQSAVGWSASIQVEYVLPSNPNQPAPFVTELKRISLKLNHGAAGSFEFQTLRARHGALQQTLPIGGRLNSSLTISAESERGPIERGIRLNNAQEVF